MRQIPAILLLAVFSVSLIEPALVSEGESKLPACCRREGQHHCSMTSSQRASDGLAMQVVCASFPKAGAAPADSKMAAVRAAQVTREAVVSHPAGRAQTEALFHISFGRTRQKRGPPILHS